MAEGRGTIQETQILKKYHRGAIEVTDRKSCPGATGEPVSDSEEFHQDDRRGATRET